MPAAQNLSPHPNSCRKVILCSPVLSVFPFTPGEVVKSGGGDNLLVSYYSKRSDGGRKHGLPRPRSRSRCCSRNVAGCYFNVEINQRESLQHIAVSYFNVEIIIRSMLQALLSFVGVCLATDITVSSSSEKSLPLFSCSLFASAATQLRGGEGTVD